MQRKDKSLSVISVVNIFFTTEITENTERDLSFLCGFALIYGRRGLCARGAVPAAPPAPGPGLEVGIVIVASG